MHTRIRVRGLSLRGGQLALRLRDFHLGVLRIELCHEIAATDRLVLDDVDGHDLARDARGDGDYVGRDLRVVGRFLPGAEKRVDAVAEEQQDDQAADDEVHPLRFVLRDRRLMLGDVGGGG